jgi:4a-hydroxytetrahydrobiopterin dehydratase
VKGWERRDNSIRKTFAFKDFKESVEFLGMIRPIADAMNHHPDVCVKYNRVEVELTTHDEGGVTEKDVQLARKIDEIYKTLYSSGVLRLTFLLSLSTKSSDNHRPHFSFEVGIVDDLLQEQVSRLQNSLDEARGLPMGRALAIISEVPTGSCLILSIPSR